MPGGPVIDEEGLAVQSTGREKSGRKAPLNQQTLGLTWLLLGAFFECTPFFVRF